jgi:FkbM family methyltransferase
MQAFFFNPPAEDNYFGHIFGEVYKERVYEKIFDGKSNLTIVDIGANLGLTTYYFSQFASKVYSIEPDKDHFKCLEEMVKYNKLTNIVPINKAIYMQDGEFDFGHNENKTMNSLHTSTWDKSLPVYKVPTVTLKTLFEENKIEHVDFMKMDIEGSEYEVLGGDAFLEVAPKIDSIQIESHVWANRNPNQLIESLKNAGFKVEAIPNDASLLRGYK